VHDWLLSYDVDFHDREWDIYDNYLYTSKLESDLVNTIAEEIQELEREPGDPINSVETRSMNRLKAHLYATATAYLPLRWIAAFLRSSTHNHMW